MKAYSVIALAALLLASVPAYGLPFFSLGGGDPFGSNNNNNGHEEDPNHNNNNDNHPSQPELAFPEELDLGAPALPLYPDLDLEEGEIEIQYYDYDNDNEFDDDNEYEYEYEDEDDYEYNIESPLSPRKRPRLQSSTPPPSPFVDGLSSQFVPFAAHEPIPDPDLSPSQLARVEHWKKEIRRIFETTGFYEFIPDEDMSRWKHHLLQSAETLERLESGKVDIPGIRSSLTEMYMFAHGVTRGYFIANIGNTVEEVLKRMGVGEYEIDFAKLQALTLGRRFYFSDSDSTAKFADHFAKYLMAMRHVPVGLSVEAVQQGIVDYVNVMMDPAVSAMQRLLDEMKPLLFQFVHAYHQQWDAQNYLLSTLEHQLRKRLDAILGTVRPKFNERLLATLRNHPGGITTRAALYELVDMVRISVGRAVHVDLQKAVDEFLDQYKDRGAEVMMKCGIVMNVLGEYTPKTLDSMSVDFDSLWDSFKE